MNEEQILNILEDVFRKNFPEADFVFSKDLNGNMIEDWDSLSHIHLISDIRDAFKITFSAKDMRRLNDVDSIVAMIKLKTKC